MKKILVGVFCVVLLSCGIILISETLPSSSIAQEYAGELPQLQMPQPRSHAGFPPNAQDVQSLVRARYTFKSEAVVAFEKLISHAEAGKVEVRKLGKSSGQLTHLQVTTDAKTQRSIAEFLHNAFPAPNVDQADIQSLDAPATVLLKLPGMT